jgi:hypothetical protein
MEKDSPAVNPAIEEVRQRLDSWRKTKKNHHEPIPEDLWQAAADLARAHSVNSVSKALRLSYTDLKDHACGHTKSRTKKRKRSSFVEIEPMVPSPFQEVTMEMENTKGSKVKISLKDLNGSRIMSLAETFLNKLP